jgi:Kef-type K+ transport system membrane component KefB
MTQAVATALVLLLMWSLKQFHWLEELGGPFTSSTVAVGFVLLTGYMAGKMAHRYKLPRITGYILVGILVGPYLLDLVSHEMTRQLQLINGLALSLIALTAGGELRLRELQPIWKSLFAITFLHVALLGVVFTGFVCLFGGWFPFLKGASWQTLLVVGSILGVLAAASSPAVAMAIINECRSEGPVTRSVLGVTVIKDIFVIILFSAVLAVGRGILEPEIPLDWAFLGVVSLEILVSLCVGILLGALIFLYLRFVNAENTLFVSGVCFICAELGLAFHLEPAIIALSAGFFMENVYAQRSDRLVHAIEQGSFPVYILFFCLAGAVLNVEALKQMWPLALILVGLRILVLMGATALGARLGRASEGMRRLGWYGFVAQAGVSLGLAAMLLRAFPDWAGPLQTLIVAIIAINQLIGPIGFRYALIRSREVC